jgi:predicted HTH transcriptional regulator
LKDSLVDIPNSLDGWNLDVIEAIAATGDEGERYDFKLQLPDPDRVTAIACAFANTYGGFIVVGVGQQNGKFKIKGIEPDPEIYKHFHDKIQCEPEIRTEPPQKLFLENGNIVYVFHIKESQISALADAFNAFLSHRLLSQFWRRQSRCMEPVETMRYDL